MLAPSASQAKQSKEEAVSDLIPLEEGRTAFGTDSQGYLDAGPDYPARVYDILRACGAASQNARVFEIGAGTGQATAPLLALGCKMTAIEPDARLATLLGRRLEAYGPALTVMQSTFEEAMLPAASFTSALPQWPCTGFSRTARWPRCFSFCGPVAGGPCGGLSLVIRMTWMHSSAKPSHFSSP